MTSDIQFRAIGLSSDRRTNKWEVVCLCGQRFQPHTTLLARQSFNCPKCDRLYVANWNKPEVRSMTPQERTHG